MDRAGRNAPLWRQRLAAGVVAGLVVASTTSGIAFAQDGSGQTAEEQAIEAATEDAGAIGVLGALDQARADQEAAALAAQEAAAQEAVAQEAAAQAAAAEPVAQEAPAEEVVAEQAVPVEEAAPVEPAAPAPSFAEQAAADALPEGIDAAALFAPEPAAVEQPAAPVAEPAEVGTADAAIDDAASDAAGNSAGAGAGNGGNSNANGDAGRVTAEQPAPEQRVAAEQPVASERGSVVGLRNRLVGAEETTTGGLEVGNGGTGSASADGGYILIDDITTGNNSGNTINACGVGAGSIDGGSVVNESTFNMEIGGGTALGIAPGGDLNSAGPTRDGVTGGIITNGNGGVALGSADGGWIVINELDTGGNTGNSINAGCEGGGGYAGDGTVSIDGGTVTNTSTFNISATGGTAIADGSGGDENAGAVGGAAAEEEDRRRRGVVGLRNELLGIDSGPVGGVLSVGNGGTGRATADGGIVIIDSIDTGGNTGNTINVGGAAGSGGGGGEGYKPSGNPCLPSNLSIDGGDVAYSSEFDISADGGTAIADGSGGGTNFGFGNVGGVLSVGSGGSADATANGGLVQIENIDTGNNSGNTIDVAGVGCAQLAAPAAKPSGPVAKPAAAAKLERAAKPAAAAPEKKAAGARAAAPKTVRTAQAQAQAGGSKAAATRTTSARAARGGANAVRSLPSTGVGTERVGTLVAGTTFEALALLGALALVVLLAAGRRLAPRARVR